MVCAIIILLGLCVVSFFAGRGSLRFWGRRSGHGKQTLRQTNIEMVDMARLEDARPDSRLSQEEQPGTAMDTLAIVEDVFLTRTPSPSPTPAVSSFSLTRNDAVYIFTPLRFQLSYVS